MTTPPAFDLSRTRLRQISHWIRDELDPLVAREGPAVLQPDDVLALHDIFQALVRSYEVTALDLRATGIHRAVMEISGIATRWPGRLADDCDTLISVWTARFGRLEDLHPFLYGRGGRLEGIASIEETSKAALLDRWRISCPDAISPKRARRRGALGFRPGSWWINPLFACHAGIIDMNSVDGGICHDRHGAYSILLTGGDELDAPSSSTLTYRCRKEDRGRYRLTAATPRSREPLRLLRSHSVNSMWGPRAGVRYEGLYRVTGWAIHRPSATSNSSSPGVRLRDLDYDVYLERCDSVPMEEVVKFPTSSELDDYSEYKRLRKLYRDLRSRGIATSPDVHHILPAPKVAPAVIPMATVPLGSDALSTAPFDASTTSLKVGDVESGALSAAVDEDISVSRRSSTHLAPMLHTKTSDQSPSTGSKDTVVFHGSNSQNPQLDLEEIAPWIAQDPPHLTLPSASDSAPSRRSTNRTTGSDRPPGKISSHPSSPMPMSRKTTYGNNARLSSSPSGHDLNSEQELGTKERMSSVLKRSLKPMTKIFDGTIENSSQALDYITCRLSSSVLTIRESPSPTRRRIRSSSLGDIAPNMSPIPHYLWLSMRRDAISLPDTHATSAPIATAKEDDEPATQRHPDESTFVDDWPNQSFHTLPLGFGDRSTQKCGVAATAPMHTSTWESPGASLPLPLENFTMQSHAATAAPKATYSPNATQAKAGGRSESVDITTNRMMIVSRLEEVAHDLEGPEVRLAFRNPFGGPTYRRNRTRSSNVAPDAF